MDTQPQSWESVAYLTVAEAAALLRIGRGTAYRAVDKGDLPSIRVLGSIRIPRSAIDALENENVPPDAAAKPDQDGAEL